MNIYECNYIATKNNTKMHVIDWIHTGGTLSVNSIGHFWKVRGYTISNASYTKVDKQRQENAIIVFLN